LPFSIFLFPVPKFSPSNVVLRMRNCSRLCYRFLFSMMTQTPLSAARRTRRGEKLPTPAQACATTRKSGFQPQVSSFHNLTANLRLTFRAKDRKISLLRIPNRKYFAISRNVSSSCSRFESLAPSLRNLILTPRLKNRISRSKQSPNRNSLIVTKRRFRISDLSAGSEHPSTQSKACLS
jgi:hypothetical protein